MKKLSLAIILSCIVAAVFTSCSSNSPRRMAETALKCLQKEDYKGLLDCVYFKENAEKNRAFYLQIFEEKVEKNPDAILESYKFVSEEIDEEIGKATVVFETTYKDGNVKTESFDMICDEDGKWWIDSKK